MVTFVMWFNALTASIMAAPEVIAFIIFVLLVDRI